MGLLTNGTPLAWEDAEKWVEHVRKHGLDQFVNQYNQLKERKNDLLYWGDEIEFCLVKYNDAAERALLNLRGAELLVELMKEEEESPESVKTLWRPEYGKFMLEGTPGRPYGRYTSDLRVVQSNMKYRRSTVRRLLKDDESMIAITSFPLMGVGQFAEMETIPDINWNLPTGDVAQSLYIPDEVISPHPRFSTLTANIRKRRGRKVSMQVPIFKDKNTPERIPGQPDDVPPNTIDMDCMAFGMGCACLQVTFQARDIEEARHLYDQLSVLSPIFLALTAATPILRGHLADTDVRWGVIAGSVDDRKKGELGEAPLAEGERLINKSRYDSIDCYISNHDNYKEEYNDLPLVYSEEYCKSLMERGIDEKLARHISHLFIRDPLVMYNETMDQDDMNDTDHFENIQSTNWQTVRFKLPPPNSTIGWRVEFRSMEVQLTDFENAAFVVIIALMTRIILTFDLNLYIPITKVDENMKRAHKRNAVNTEKFYFRKHITKEDCDLHLDEEFLHHPDDPEAYELMTISEIISGKSRCYPGLNPLIRLYLDEIDCDSETLRVVQSYLDFIEARARGELQTTAEWMRSFCQQHPDYKQDSVVSQKMAYDLLKLADEIMEGTVCPVDLLGEVDHLDEPIKKVVSHGPNSVENHGSIGVELRGSSYRDAMREKHPGSKLDEALSSRMRRPQG